MVFSTPGCQMQKPEAQEGRVTSQRQEAVALLGADGGILLHHWPTSLPDPLPFLFPSKAKGQGQGLFLGEGPGRMAEGDAPCGRRLGPPKTARGSAPSPKRRRRQAQSGPCPSARPEETGQLPKAPGTGGRPGLRAAARPGAGEPRRREKGGVVSAGWRCQSVSGWSPCPGPSSGCGRLPTKVCARVEMGREVAAGAEPSSSAPPSVSGTLPAGPHFRLPPHFLSHHCRDPGCCCRQCLAFDLPAHELV